MDRLCWATLLRSARFLDDGLVHAPLAGCSDGGVMNRGAGGPSISLKSRMCGRAYHGREQLGRTGH